MQILKIGTFLVLGEVVAIKNGSGGVRITLDYYGKVSDYTTEEIEGVL